MHHNHHLLLLTPHGRRSATAPGRGHRLRERAQHPLHLGEPRVDAVEPCVGGEVAVGLVEGFVDADSGLLELARHALQLGQDGVGHGGGGVFGPCPHRIRITAKKVPQSKQGAHHRRQRSACGK